MENKADKRTAKIIANAKKELTTLEETAHSKELEGNADLTADDYEHIIFGLKSDKDDLANKVDELQKLVVDKEAIIAKYESAPVAAPVAAPAEVVADVKKEDPEAEK